jgi:ubiquinone/menaquinone biosynthesis C-methylase UbiE
VAVLGCTTGADFEAVDPAVTEVAVGVDINAHYLAAAASRSAALGRRVQFICGDVLNVTLSQASFDLVHAALLLEYVDAGRLFHRVHRWLAVHGVFSIISQPPIPGVAAVSTTKYESLRRLAGQMSLRSADEIEEIGACEGFAVKTRRMLELPSGKILCHSMFEVERAAQPAVAADGASPRR